VDAERFLIVLPTYEERDNLPRVVEQIEAVLPGLPFAGDVLVVDDSSPDGTGEIADRLAAESDGHIHVMHRTEKNGLGAAYVAGFTWGMERDYAVLVEMDADGSHAPEDLPRMLDALEDADLAIGSRYVPGGKIVNWPKRRYLLSWGANTFTRVALGARVKDMTAGFRAYRREALQKIRIDNVASRGYCFQIDLGWRTIEAGFTVVEVPITFTEREHGVSKMGSDVIREALIRVTKWGLRRRRDQVKALLKR
jgi:dolichol-phosphate mannosyltransferase